MQTQKELPMYIAAAEDVSPEVKVADWWKNHETEIPAWAQACKLILLVQPSSASAERVFSILQNSFTHQQHSFLEDYISVSCMLQFIMNVEVRIILGIIGQLESIIGLNPENRGIE